MRTILLISHLEDLAAEGA